MLRTAAMLAALALAGCVAPSLPAPSVQAAEPASLAGRATVHAAGASYLDRSVDKTIIVRRGRAATWPGQPGQGTRYIFVPRR